MFRERIKQGRANLKYKGDDIVAADAITLLSGVNFGSVVKVIAAMEALRGIPGTNIDSLIALPDVPIDHVMIDYDRSEKRRSVSLRLCTDIASDPELEPEIKRILLLEHRLRGKRPVYKEND